MRVLIVFSLAVGMLAAVEQPKKEAAPEPPPAAPSVRQAGNLQIPASAVKAEDGYHYTDAQGKKWIYRKTPFGVSRVEDKPADANARAAEAKQTQEVKAFDEGEYVRFERPGPFGVYKWRRKKTELDEMEKTVWERDQAHAAAK